jgi:uncharacterized membrane protein
MWPRDVPPFHAGVVLIDLIGGLFVVGYVVAAVVRLLRTGAIAPARLLVAEGAVLGLSFKTAGTLLKTLEIHTWEQIGMFGAVLALRVVLKQLFVWERTRIERRSTSTTP